MSKKDYGCTEVISFCQCGAQLKKLAGGIFGCPECDTEVNKDDEITLTIKKTKKDTQYHLDFNSLDIH